jgi:DNA-binding IclR family transcriptional regulator
LSSDTTLNEINAMLDALDAKGERARGITTQELAAERGISVQKARDLLRPLVAAGQLRQTVQVRTPADGPYWLGVCSTKVYVRVGG